MRRVAGVGFDGSTVGITFGKKEIRIIKAAYGDTLESEFLSYMGSQSQDEQSPGVYKTDDVKLTMSRMVFLLDFMPELPPSGGGNQRFPIVITRSHPDAGDDSDLLEDCRIKALPASLENTAAVEQVEVTLTTRQVRWGKERKTINAAAGTVTGPIGF